MQFVKQFARQTYLRLLTWIFPLKVRTYKRYSKDCRESARYWIDRYFVTRMEYFELKKKYEDLIRATKK